MLSKVVRAFKNLGRKEPESTAQHQLKDVHGNKVDVSLLLQANPARVQSYPPNPRAIPVIQVEHILSEMDDIIQLTKEQGAVPEVNDGGYTFENMYLETIKRFASYAHVLPASLNWHHFRPGGLLYHSLDVGLRSLMWAKDNAVPRWGHIDEDVKRRPAWVFAAWLGGLLHDSGKILTDVTVVGNNGEIWDPEEEDLIKWSVRTKVGNYNYEHKTTRTLKGHERLASEMIAKVISPKAKAFIKSSPDNLMDELKNALRGYDNSKSYLAKAIRQGDFLSTQEDVEKIWSGCLEQRTAALYEQVVKAMLALQPNWDCNSKDSHVFQLGGHVFLKYPDALEQIIEKLRSAGVNTPASAKTLAEILMDRQIIIPADADSIYGMLDIGKFKKSDIVRKMKAKNEAFKIRVVRISWPGYVFGTEVLPPSITGYVKRNSQWDVTHYTEKSYYDYTGEELKEIALDLNNGTPTNDVEETVENIPVQDSERKPDFSTAASLKQASSKKVKKQTQKPKPSALRSTKQTKPDSQPINKPAASKEAAANAVELKTDTPKSTTQSTQDNLTGSIKTKKPKKLPAGIQTLTSPKMETVNSKTEESDDKKPEAQGTSNSNPNQKVPAETKAKKKVVDANLDKPKKKVVLESMDSLAVNANTPNEPQSDDVQEVDLHADILGVATKTIPTLQWVAGMTTKIDTAIDSLLVRGKYEFNDGIVCLSYDLITQESGKDKREVQDHFRNRSNYTHESALSSRPVKTIKKKVYAPLSEFIVNHYPEVCLATIRQDAHEENEVAIEAPAQAEEELITNVAKESNFESPTVNLENDAPVQEKDKKQSLEDFILSHATQLAEANVLIQEGDLYILDKEDIINALSNLGYKVLKSTTRMAFKRMNTSDKDQTHSFNAVEKPIWTIKL